MDERKLLTTALICSLIGIFIILSISENISPKKYNIINITKETLNKQVILTGTISKIKTTDELTILTLKDNTGEITVVIFDKNLNLEPNKKITVEGKVIEYKGTLEIQASRIKETL
jgi:DNA/RNA endonuclease YhcR with UshA esterase domain